MAVRPQNGMTYAEYSQLPHGDGRRYELIDGELYVIPAPTAGHQRILLRLAVRVASHLE